MNGARPRLELLAAALLFSTGGAAIKLTALGVWEVAGLRSGIAALFLWLVLPAARRRPTLPVLAVAAAYAATLALFVAGNKLTTAANTIFLQSTAPLWVLLLAPRLLGEGVRRRDLVYMVALAAGLAMFFAGAQEPSATAPDPRTGNLLAVVSGVTWALTLLGLRGLGRAAAGNGASGDGSGDIRPAAGGAQAVLFGNLLVLAVCLPGMIATGPVSGPGAAGLAAATWVDWSAVTYLGVVQIGLAYVFLTGAMGRVPALEASLLLLTEPVLSPLWAWLALGERPAPWAIAGGAVIVAATALKTGLDARRSVRGTARG